MTEKIEQPNNKITPKKRWKKYLQETVIFLLIAVVMIVAVDIYRMPNEKGLHSVSLTTIDGKTIHFAQQKTPVILYFWASWCIYCRHTSKTINTLAQEGYPVITVALQSGDEKEVQNYLQQHHFIFPVINDPDGNISDAFSIVATPTIAIVNNNKISIATSGFTSKYGLKLRYWLAKIKG